MAAESVKLAKLQAESVKLAKLQAESVKLAKLQSERELMNQLITFISHPVIITVGAFALIEYLQTLKVNNQPFMGNIVGTGLETVLGIRLIAEYLPSLTEVGGLLSLAGAFK